MLTKSNKENKYSNEKSNDLDDLLDIDQSIGDGSA
jgi:hypothetical protein